MGLNPDKLTVTVYLDDDEAFDIWNKEIKLDSSRILATTNMKTSGRQEHLGWTGWCLWPVQ
ncbi:MAG: hypothetical protein R3C11_20360 [Planctomycetaceae bacterium]